MPTKRLLFAAIIAVLLLGALAPAAAQDKVTVNWFVGLGTGANAEQQEVQNQVVDRKSVV